ncbi:MAG: type II secretion system minor pseudopilin GspK [Gammaproteobacteria bacterium]|nr:type II secretion system minor pseudopilin GspK [Gammaproteobacteria bacterium]
MLNKKNITGVAIQSQKGMALLMAIMIVALVAIISVNMLFQRQLEIYRTANLYFREQAYQYSLAIERWGVSALAQDFEQEKTDKQHSDSYQDIWNTALVNFEVEQAKIDGIILDLQGRFNLNNLVVNGVVDKKWEATYKRLLKTLNLPLALSDSLVDWMDANEQPTGSFGAEDIYYIALDQPYRASNQSLVNVSELFLIKGYDKKTIDILKPHVFVSKDMTPININTSTPIVLMSIIPGLLEDQAESLIEQIDKTPFTEVETFLKDPLIKDKAIEPVQISVASSYFTVVSHVLIDKTMVSLQSVLKRDEQGTIQVLNRQESLWYESSADKKSAQDEKQ